MAIDAALRPLGNRVQRVIAAGRAHRKLLRLEERQQIGLFGKGIISFVILECPILFSAIDFAEIGDAGVSLGGAFGFCDSRQSHGGYQACWDDRGNSQQRAWMLIAVRDGDPSLVGVGADLPH